MALVKGLAALAILSTWLLFLTALCVPGTRTLMTLMGASIVLPKVDLLSIVGSVGGMAPTRHVMHNAVDMLSRVIILPTLETSSPPSVLTLDVSSDGEHILLNELLTSFILQSWTPQLQQEGKAGRDDIYSKFILDIGAYDGVVGSNSLNLLRQGWGGLLVEPVGASMSALNETVLAGLPSFDTVRIARVGVGLKDIENAYVDQFDSSGMQSSVRASGLYANKPSKSTEQVRILSPATLLQEFGPVPSQPAVLSVDIESSDTLDIITAILRQGIHPALIVVEWLGSTLPNRRLFAHRHPEYEPVSIIGMNHVWRRRQTRKQSTK